MLVKAEIGEDGTAALKLYPAVSSAGYTRTMEEGKLPAFYEKMEALSEEIQITEDGWVVPEKASP